MLRARAACVPFLVLLWTAECQRQHRPQESSSTPEGLRANYVPAGTEIKVKTLRTISSLAVSPGESIEVALAEPLAVDGQTKVPAGARAIVSVVDAKPGVARDSSAQVFLKLTQLRRNLLDRVDLNTQGVRREGVEIEPGSVLTFRLESPALLESPPGK